LEGGVEVAVGFADGADVVEGVGGCRVGGFGAGHVGLWRGVVRGGGEEKA